MPKHSLPDLFVLDTLANDYEDLESILRLLNSDTELGWKSEWGRPFVRDEVVSALSRLVRAGRVRIAGDSGGGAFEELPPEQLPAGSYDEVYFGMTERGRIVHSSWDVDTADP